MSWPLAATVLLAGAATLGIEMLASRLLAPYFGTSQPIWAVIIGMTLLYLALGYHVGGRLADRRPHERLLYHLIAIAAFATALIPLIARPILLSAQTALSSAAVGGLLGALAGVLILFAVPVTLLAMVSPFAIRLQLHHSTQGIEAAGRTAGTLSALSTLGSILGTFLTVLVLIPSIGTARTLFLYALLLAALALFGARDRFALLAVLAVLAITGIQLGLPTAVKSAGCRDCTLISEYESAYNYIQVAERVGPAGDRQIALVLNEGLAIHSIYRPLYEHTHDARDLLTDGGPWDYFAITPFFYPQRSPDSVHSMALLGAGAGTAAAQFLAIYGPDRQVDAIEIDPQIIAVGRRYFGLQDASTSSAHPNYRVYAADARAWLSTSNTRYDIVAIDAYHQPYIPFHLTTREFFEAVRDHLNERGLVVVNAGLGPDGDDRLGQAIAATMRAVFAQVYIIETKRGGNQILVGVPGDVGDGWANMVANYKQLTNATLREIIGNVNVSERPIDPRYTPMTDDHAPIEALIDSLIFDTALR